MDIELAKKIDAACRNVLNTKRTRIPYRRNEWVMGGELATRTHEALESVVPLIQQLIDSDPSYAGGKVRACRGTGYFPRWPWIGVFYPGQTATNGVYPVISFAERGDSVVVGCTESFAHPKIGFEKFIVKFNDWKLKIPYNAHIAEGVKQIFFDNDNGHDDTQVAKALLAAASKYIEYANRNNISDGTAKEVTAASASRADDVSAWRKDVYVDDIEGWLKFVRKLGELKGKRLWVFRGQGLDEWDLCSSAERSIKPEEGCPPDDDQVDDLLNKECNAVRMFIREAANNPEYRRNSMIDYLALMQHYGCKTRLLDFSRSPLVSLFMAQESNETIVSSIKAYFDKYCDNEQTGNGKLPTKFAVWAICLDLFMTDEESGNWNTFIERSFEKAREILPKESSKNGEKIIKKSSSQDEPGIVALFPEIGCERLSVQEGLFLVQKRVGYPFGNEILDMMRNSARIRSCIPEDADFSQTTISQIQGETKEEHLKAFFCYKFIFDNEVVGRQIRDVLRITRSGAKYIYPDLGGLAKGISDYIYNN